MKYMSEHIRKSILKEFVVFSGRQSFRTMTECVLCEFLELEVFVNSIGQSSKTKIELVFEFRSMRTLDLQQS